MALLYHFHNAKLKYARIFCVVTLLLNGFGCAFCRVWENYVRNGRFANQFLNSLNHSMAKRQFSAGWINFIVNLLNFF